MVSQTIFDQANARGQAEALLRTKTLTDAFDYLQQAYIDAWRSGADTVARERAWHLLTALDAFKSHLEAVVATGRLAQQDLDRISGRLS